MQPEVLAGKLLLTDRHTVDPGGGKAGVQKAEVAEFALLPSVHSPPEGDRQAGQAKEQIGHRSEAAPQNGAAFDNKPAPIAELIGDGVEAK